jgi:hypothetical protein
LGAYEARCDKQSECRGDGNLAVMPYAVDHRLWQPQIEEHRKDDVAAGHGAKKRYYERHHSNARGRGCRVQLKERSNAVP